MAINITLQQLYSGHRKKACSLRTSCAPVQCCPTMVSQTATAHNKPRTLDRKASFGHSPNGRFSGGTHGTRQRTRLVSILVRPLSLGIPSGATTSFLAGRLAVKDKGQEEGRGGKTGRGKLISSFQGSIYSFPYERIFIDESQSIYILQPSG